MIIRSVFVLLVLLVTGPLLPVPRSVYACSCAVSPGGEWSVDRAELVVVGWVEEIEERSSHGYDLTILVDEYLKGSGEGTLTVFDGSLQGPACSPFDPEAVGKKYLLFLSTQGEHLVTNICDGSTVIDARTRDQVETTIQQIRQIVAGSPAPADADATATAPEAELPASGSGGGQSDNNREWLFAGGAAAMLGLAGGAAALWRGTRRASGVR